MRFEGNPDVDVGRGLPRARARWPRWFDYALVVFLEAALTALLVLIQSLIPMPKFQAPYAVLIAAVGFLLGTGPTILAFVLSLIAYDYFFISPVGTLWPPATTAQGWAAIVMFALVSFIAGSLSVVARRSQQRAERLTNELRESQERYRALVENIVEWVWEVDDRAIYTYSSPQVREMLGYEPEEVLGKTPYDFMPKDEAIKIKPAFEAIAAKGLSLVQLENTLVRKDGSRIVVETSGNPILSHRGAVRGYRGIDRDITQRKRAEQALRESEEKFRSIVETNQEWIWEVSREGRHIYSNAAIERILGFCPEEIMGRDVLPMMHEDDRAKVMETMAQFAAEKRGWESLVIRWRHANGTYRWLESTVIPVFDEHGEVTGFRGSDRDITDRVCAEEALRKDFDRERRIAEVLQTSLLTPVPDQIDCFLFETVYRAAWDEAAVGGDFYDVFVIGDDKIGIVVGDVSGKGLSAAAQVAMVKYFLRAGAYESTGPSVVLEHVNKALVSDASAEGFATVLFGILDCPSRTLTYANGGHSPAILWRAAQREVLLLEPTGIVVGYDRDARYAQETVQLHPGDEIFVGTDGLYEVQCEGRYLELEGLVQLYADMMCSGGVTAVEVVRRVAEFCNHKLRDDVAVLRVRVAE